MSGGVFICPPPAPEEFPRDGLICVGFGRAVVERDGEVVADGETDEWAESLTGAEAERMAAADPDHVWEIHLRAPLLERRYRREGREIGRWVLTEKGPGFA